METVHTEAMIIATPRFVTLWSLETVTGRLHSSSQRRLDRLGLLYPAGAAGCSHLASSSCVHARNGFVP